MKDIAKKVFELFCVNDIGDFTDAVKKVVFSDKKNDIYDAYVKICPNLTVDYMQKIYQFYCADRKEKKQDYTPVVLSKIIAKIVELPDGVVYDCCAGSGSLTIQQWVLNKNYQYILEELDENVIPILLFNLSIRNINAKVIQKDILKDQVFKSYTVSSGQKYSSIQEDMFAKNVESMADICISNPPFNLKTDICKKLLETAPEKCTCNFAFVENCIQRCKRFCAVILPSGCACGKIEKKCREHYIKKGILRAVINMPEKMFESTGVSTCIFFFDKNKTTQDVMLVDATKMSSTEVRLQKGEGDACHTQRIYQKTFNTFSDTQVNAVAGLALGAQADTYSKVIGIAELEEKEYNMTLPVYLPIEIGYTVHRDFNAIIDDINKIKREKNNVRININKVWAENLNLKDIIMLNKQNNEVTKSINDSLNMFSNYTFKSKLLDDNFIKENASKCLMIENSDKESLSSIMKIFFPMWKQHLLFLNDLENNLLIELRDSMLPYLMNGDLQIKQESI